MTRALAPIIDSIYIIDINTVDNLTDEYVIIRLEVDEYSEQSKRMIRS